jgi:hypothetical protein
VCVSVCETHIVGVGGEAAAAAVVPPAAVDDLLHRESGQLVAGQRPLRLNVLGRRERPARRES